MKENKIISLSVRVQFANSKIAAKFVKKYHWHGWRSTSIVATRVAASVENFNAELEAFKKQIAELNGRVVFACNEDDACITYNTYFVKRK